MTTTTTIPGYVNDSTLPTDAYLAGYDDGYHAALTNPAIKDTPPPAIEWAGRGKAHVDPIELARTIQTALRPLGDARRTDTVATAKAALLDPQALALVVAIRELGAGTVADLDAALALALHTLGR